VCARQRACEPEEPLSDGKAGRPTRHQPDRESSGRWWVVCSAPMKAASNSSEPDVQRDMSAKTMKKRRGPGNRHVVGELVSEYRFDYAKSRANRFARRIAKNAVVVFRDPKRVNSLLRATIAALKKPGSRRAG